MRLLKLVPDNTNIGFVRLRYWAFGLTALLSILSIALVATRGLNLGVDFVGGLMLEEKFAAPPPLGKLRATIERLNVGEPVLQPIGDQQTVTIRLPAVKGDDAATNALVERVQKAVRADFPGSQLSRRDSVTGKVSNELLTWGGIGVGLAILGIALFSWLRYEWQFGVSTFVAVFHDLLMTLGFFALTRFEVDLNIVAAVLTIIGYSINDKIVIDDRIRENLRKYRQMDLRALIDQSVNETLPRTVMTSVTILLALLSLLIFGGHVLRGFTAAMMLGIVVGTYSSIYVSSSLLISLGLGKQRDRMAAKAGAAQGNAERVQRRNPNEGARP